MRAVVITKSGGPDVLQVQEVPDAIAGPGEVLVDVVAAGLNRADLLQRQGFYPVPPGGSRYPGMECSGRIAALGPDVAGWEIGAEVCALLTGGGHAEKVAVPVGQLLPRPEGVSLVDAAGLPEVACTVWSMIIDDAGLQAGETLLVHGGSSGIGTMAIQLAKRIGARVIVTVGSQRKQDFCADLGADVTINYRDEDFATVVFEQTQGRGVDVILDNMGASYLDRNIASLAMGGRLVIIGMQGGTTGEVNLNLLLMKRARIIAASLRSRPLEQKAAIVAGVAAHVWPAVEAGEVRPIINSVLSLDEVAKAHELMESSEHIGKILLTP